MAESAISNFYDELKRRRVIRVATLYVVAIWPIIQLLDIISPTLDLPESVLRYLVIAFFAGLPFALISAWLFDVDEPASKGEEGTIKGLLGSRTDVTIVGVLCVLVVLLFIVQVALNDDQASELETVPEVVQSPDPAQPADSNRESLPVSNASIAVKPFDSFSVDPQDQFFADGLSEEILNVLARVPELRVAARTSSFAYKGVNKNISEIGRELNVAHILEGSVRANDINNTIRVTAQLIDVASGQHIWSETYTHKFNDVFRIQDEISQEVAKKLKVTLVGGLTPNGQSDVVRTTNPEVLIAYGRGQQELAKRTQESFSAAASYFQTAIDADPNFALAYAGLGDTLSLQVNYGYGDKEAQFKEAETVIDQALALDPNLGIAWASKGLLQSQDKENVAAARLSLEKAMALNPSYAMAVMWYASLEEDSSERLRLYERAVELDPKSPVAAYNLAQMYADQGRGSDVMRLFGQMVEADPNYPKGYELIGRVNVRSGQLGEAIRYFKRAYELEADGDLAVTISKLYADLGDYKNSDAWFEGAAELMPEQYQRRISWFRIGRYVAAGETETVTKMLEDIRALPGDSLEAEYDRIQANYYLGETDSIVADYEKSVGKTFTEKDGYFEDQTAETLIAVADQMMKEGKVEQAAELLNRSETIMTAQAEDPRLSFPGDYYQLARISAVRGEDQRALIHLQRAVDGGWRERWRPANDPAMQRLQEDSIYRTMMAGLENRLGIIRDQLQLEAEFAMSF